MELVIGQSALEDEGVCVEDLVDQLCDCRVASI